MIAQYVPYAMAAVLLVAMAIELRTGKIPNWLTLVPFVLFIAVAATGADRTALAWQLGLAALVFAVGIVLFIFAGFGAGAVKLMTGIALFVPWDKGLTALVIFVGVLFVSTFLIVNLRKFVPAETSNWHVFTASRALPLSLPLGITGLWVLFMM